MPLMTHSLLLNLVSHSLLYLLQHTRYVGEKRWFVLPPGERVTSNLHPLLWLRGMQQAREGGGGGGDSGGGDSGACRACEEAGMLEVTQRAGDLLYLPAMWAHSVLNVRDAMAQAVEFSGCGGGGGDGGGEEEDEHASSGSAGGGWAAAALAAEDAVCAAAGADEEAHW